MALTSKHRTYEDVPTFKEYCKNLEDFQNPIVSYVHKIWRPNKYPSISLTTDSYLLRIHQKSDIFADLLECIAEWEEEEACVFVRLLDPKTLEFEIDSLEGEKSTWAPLGDYGSELTIQPKKRAVKGKRAPRESQSP